MVHHPTRCPSLPVRLAWLALASCLALGGCRSASDVPTLVAEAASYRERGDLAAAAIQLKNALQQDPANARARALLGELYLETGNPVSAEKELRRARAGSTDAAGLAPLIGKAMLMQGQYQQVLRELGADVASAHLAVTLALRGSAELGLGRPDAALALFEQALARHPDLPDALLGQARIAWQRNEAARATTLIARALASAPAHVDCLRFQGELLRAQGKPEQALASHRAILAQRPQDTQAHLDSGHIHLDGARFELARAAFAAARKSGGASGGVLYAEALLAFRLVFGCAFGVHRVWSRDLIAAPPLRHLGGHVTPAYDPASCHVWHPGFPSSPGQCQSCPPGRYSSPP